MNLDNKVEGAWIIHHANKLQTVTNAASFENISIAGKAGMLLSALSTSDQLVLGNDKVKILANQANIAKSELDFFLDLLSKQELIAKGT
ncbi:MAG: hypothetical protein PHR87_04530, partial [Sulfurospirillaceae bacterium]|nr:hypothetical protein [Sulfurospirillaceae bacterium]